MEDERFKLLFLFGLGILYCLALGVLFQQLPSKGYNDDFHARWYASRQRFETGRSIYDWQNAEEVSKLTGWPLVYELRYYFPAYLLIFTAPLSFLPYSLARFMDRIWALGFMVRNAVIFAFSEAGFIDQPNHNPFGFYYNLITSFSAHAERAI